jgi:hypothetical protein
MRSDTIDDPETALRNRIRGRLLTATPEGGEAVETGPPIPAAPFAPAVPAAAPAEPPPSPPVVAAPPAPAAPVPWTPAPAPTAPKSTPTIGIPGGPERRGEITVEPAAGAADAGGLDDRAWFYSLFGGTQGSPLTPAQLAALAPKLAERGFTLAGTDSIRSPSGMVIDVIQGAKSGQNLAQWLQPNQGGGAGASAGAGNAAAAGAGSAGASAPGVSDWYSQIRALLMQRLGMAGQPVDQNAPEIADPLSAARDEVSRGQDLERKTLAERLYASGDLHSSTLPQQLQQSAERNATGLSQLRAGLISKEYTARRDELQNLLQLAMASGDAELARSIQMQIAQLQAAVNREGLGISVAQLQAQLNQNAYNAAAGR